MPILAPRLIQLNLTKTEDIDLGGLRTAAASFSNIQTLCIAHGQSTGALSAVKSIFAPLKPNLRSLALDMPRLDGKDLSSVVRPVAEKSGALQDLFICHHNRVELCALRQLASANTKLKKIDLYAASKGPGDFFTEDSLVQYLRAISFHRLRPVPSWKAFSSLVM